MIEDGTAALSRYLESAGLADGDRLPPERDLAPLLGISRRALRRALSSLELEGQLWRGVGRGTFLGTRPSVGFDRLPGKLDSLSPHEILEARLAFEPVIAASAALKATPRDLARIENCVRKNVEAGDDTIWARWDGAFHRSIAEATRNALFVALAEALVVARQEAQWGALRTTRVGADSRRSAANGHWEILKALKARDQREAAQAMRRHLRHVAEMLVIDSVL